MYYQTDEVLCCQIEYLRCGKGDKISPFDLRKNKTRFLRVQNKTTSFFLLAFLSSAMGWRLLLVISSVVGCVRSWCNSFLIRGDKSSNDLQRSEETHMKNIYGAAEASEGKPVSCIAEEELEKLHQAERDELEKVHRTEKFVVTKHHNQSILANQCTSTLIQKINAPVDVVWGILSLFEKPQSYSNFVKNCSLLEGNGSPGSVREVTLVSGLPMTKSTERLEFLDKENHVWKVRGNLGEEDSESVLPNRLKRGLQDYLSVTSMHERVIDGQRKTLAVQSYVIEVPEGNTAADTCTLVDTMSRCVLKSLESRSEKAALKKKTDFHTAKSCKF